MTTTDPTNEKTPNIPTQKREHEPSPRRSFFDAAAENPVAALACTAAVVLALSNAVSIWFDRSDKIEEKIDRIEEKVAVLETALVGEAGLSSRVVRLEDFMFRGRPNPADSTVPAVNDRTALGE